MRAYNLKNDNLNFDNESQFLVQNSPERKFFCQDQVLGKEKTSTRYKNAP